MGNRRFHLLSVLLFGALLLCFSDSKEFWREVVCYHDVLQLDCGDSSIIAIHQAYFTSQRQENQTICRTPLEHEDVEHLNNYSYCYEDARLIINRRCSGMKSCNFTYSTETEKRCSNPEGSLFVQYDCVRVENINKYCNVKVSAIEGYITQPGYPMYYPRLTECSWSLLAAVGQTVLVKILHLHLNPATEVQPTPSDHESILAMSMNPPKELQTQCEKDALSVLEGNMKKFSLCGENLENLKTFEADANNDLILKFTSSNFSPTNGFLAYYKIQGCPDMPAGEDSYLVERNGTAAIYACRNDLVFNDTLENTRYVHCVRNHHWSNTLSPCIQIMDASTPNVISHITATELLESNITASLNEPRPVQQPARFTEDILIPCIIMAVLIVGNGIIILIIFLLRRRAKDDLDIKEEETGLNQQPGIDEEKLEEQKPEEISEQDKP